MKRAVPVLRLLQQVVPGQSSAAEASVASTRCLSTYTFSGLTDAPPPAGSGAIKLNVKTDDKGVNVDVRAGRSSAKATYPPASIRKLQAEPLTLVDTARVSVLHSSFVEAIVRLLNERYALLAQWPDFTKMYGKDYYHRAHPDDVRKFYSLVDEFHRMYDVVTEFASISKLADELIPSYRARRMNVLGPAVGPTVANGVVTQYLLSRAAAPGAGAK
eukprot:jgi/Chrzof1/6397/Cz18g09050.t1